MGTDISEARAWVGEVLGPLATDSDNDAMLRETLALFLRERGSYKAAAEQLHLHVNSVKYRIQRAIQRRRRRRAQPGAVPGQAAMITRVGRRTR
jgi:hypothetical protein